jgi:hypothetical protein
MNKYVERLLNEWKTHGQIILALDFDSTIAPWPTIDNQEDINRCIKLVKECVSTGCYVVIHTACAPDREQEILARCNEIGIRPNSININPFNLPYGKNKFGENSKIFYNHQLCDRSGFIEAMDILEQALYKYRGYLQSQQLLDDVA